MRFSALVLALTLAAPAALAEDLACNAAVRTGFWALLASARYGAATQEHAAFVTRSEEGTYQLVLWPFESRSRQASFRGTPPDNVVAIVHTHPNSDEYPSTDDAAVALRTHVPVYVLTRSRVARTYRGTIETVWMGDWQPSSTSAHSSCESGAELRLAMAAPISEDAR